MRTPEVKRKLATILSGDVKGYGRLLTIEAVEVFRINPRFSLEKYAKYVTYKNQEDVERTISAPLRKAGLK
jgi:hypothetical protein